MEEEVRRGSKDTAKRREKDVEGIVDVREGLGKEKMCPLHFCRVDTLKIELAFLRNFPFLSSNSCFCRRKQS